MAAPACWQGNIRLALVFHAFDLLSLDGEHLTSLPNAEHKERLEALVHLTFTESRVRRDW